MPPITLCLLAALLLAATRTGAQWIPSPDDYQSLPACQDTNVSAFLSAMDTVPCLEFVSSPVVVPCPEECSETFLELGAECLAAVVRLGDTSLMPGLIYSDAALLTYTNATMEACREGSTVEPAALVAYLTEALARYPSCASADVGGALAVGGCGPQDSSTFLDGACPGRCIAFAEGLGLDCFADFTLTPLRDLGVVESEEELSDYRELLINGINVCTVTRRGTSKLQVTRAEDAQPDVAEDMLRAAFAFAFSGGRFFRLMS